MQTIHKYVLSASETIVRVPKGGVVLSVHEQYGDVCVWIQVDTEQEHEEREFEVFGTGRFIPEGHRRFIATVHLMTGQLVFHVFEKVVPVK